MTGTQAPTFEERVRERASDWKQRTPTVPAEARVPAPHIRDRNSVGCYPSACRRRCRRTTCCSRSAPSAQAFAAARIARQASIDGRPTNHLLSSQVQYVNALMPMSGSPRLVVAAFGEVPKGQDAWTFRWRRRPPSTSRAAVRSSG